MELINMAGVLFPSRSNKHSIQLKPIQDISNKVLAICLIGAKCFRELQTAEKAPEPARHQEVPGLTNVILSTAVVDTISLCVYLGVLGAQIFKSA